MPEERGYTRQVGPRPVQPMPLSRPEDFGAGIGRGIEQLGALAHREALEDDAIERRETANSEWAGFQRGFATLREDADRFTREGRKDDTPGHTRRMIGLVDQRAAPLLEGITSDEVRQRATAAIDEWRLRYKGAEADWEDVQGVNRTIANEIETSSIAGNRIRRLENPQDYLTELELGHDRIDGYNLPEDRKAAMRRDWDQIAGVSYLRGAIERDPAMAKAMIAEGLFDQLDPDTIEGLLSGADVEIRRQQAATEHAASVAVADFRERVRIVQADAGAGVDVSEQLPGLIAEARQFGLADVANTLEGISYDSAFARTYEGATPVQREQRVAALEAKGDARSEAEDRELRWLEDKQSALDSRFNGDPAGFYARTSTPPPPLDLSDPASVQARARWARAASAAAGRPVPPLTMNEAREIGALWATGQTGSQREVLDQISQFEGPQLLAAARMVDANDPSLAVMASLPKLYRDRALRGRDALRAKPQLIATADLELDQEEAIARHRARFDEALGEWAPGDRAAILAVADRLVAGGLDEVGGQLTEEKYWNALNMALGATWSGTGEARVRKGGLGSWGDRWFVLPDGVSPGEWGRAVQQAARDGIGAEKVRPINPDRSPASLSRAYPVSIGGGLYEFRTGSGAVVMGDNDRPWRILVRD